MFLTKTKRSQFYKLVYEADGKRKIISTRTPNLLEAQKFLASFTPITKPHKSSPLTLLQLHNLKMNTSHTPSCVSQKAMLKDQ